MRGKSDFALGFFKYHSSTIFLIYPNFSSLQCFPSPIHSHSNNITAMMGMILYWSSVLAADKKLGTPDLKDQKNSTPCTAQGLKLCRHQDRTICGRCNVIKQDSRNSLKKNAIRLSCY